MRRFLLGLGLLGVLLFGGALAMSWIDPLAVERLARAAIRIEVERKVGEKVAVLSDARVAGFALRALGQTDADIARAKQALGDQVPARVAQVVAQMLDRDCACRKRLAALVRQASGDRQSSLTRARERLTEMIEASYASVAGSLLREFRIVAGCNGLAFAALGLTALSRRRSASQLLAPAMVLLVAVGVTGGMYLLRQDWLHTLVFGDYVGWAYGAYLAAVTALLADVALNQGRMANVLLQAAGSVPAAIPC